MLSRKTFARVRKQSTYGIGTTNAASLDEKETRKEEKSPSSSSFFDLLPRKLETSK